MIRRLCCRKRNWINNTNSKIEIAYTVADEIFQHRELKERSTSDSFARDSIGLWMITFIPESELPISLDGMSRNNTMEEIYV